jgi:ribonuclease HI
MPPRFAHQGQTSACEARTFTFEDVSQATKGALSLSYGTNILQGDCMQSKDTRKITITDGWTHLTCPTGCRGYVEEDPIIIASHGSSLGDDMEKPRTTVGVWFGEGDGKLGSENNVSKRTDYLTSQPAKKGAVQPLDAFTSQQADITAAITALKSYRGLVLLKGPRSGDKSVIIKSDSAYLVDDITSSISKWKENGWENAGGKPVENKEHLKRLDEIIKEREKGGEKRKGTRVMFWKVPRE